MLDAHGTAEPGKERGKALALVLEQQLVHRPERALVRRGRGREVVHEPHRVEPRGLGRERALEDAIEAALSGKSVPASSTHAVGCYISDLE